MIESGSEQFKPCFDGPGMRWPRKSAKNLLPIRAVDLSGCFDQMWLAAKKLAPILK